MGNIFEAQGIPQGPRLWADIVTHELMRIPKEERVRGKKITLQGAEYKNAYKAFPIDELFVEIDPQHTQGAPGFYDDTESGKHSDGSYIVQIYVHNNYFQKAGAYASIENIIVHEIRHAFDDYNLRKGGNDLRNEKGTKGLYTDDFLNNLQYILNGEANVFPGSRPAGWASIVMELYTLSPAELRAYLQNNYENFAENMRQYGPSPSPKEALKAIKNISYYTKYQQLLSFEKEDMISLDEVQEGLDRANEFDIPYFNRYTNASDFMEQAKKTIADAAQWIIRAIAKFPSRYEQGNKVDLSGVSTEDDYLSNLLSEARLRLVIRSIL